MARQSSHPQREACSSKGSVTSPSRQRWRGAHTSNGGNKQGTSNRGTQPPTTIIGITWIHARSGQPLALTLNETVRGLTYKQEVAGSSPAPPMVDYQRSCASRATTGTQVDRPGVRAGVSQREHVQPVDRRGASCRPRDLNGQPAAPDEPSCRDRRQAVPGLHGDSRSETTGAWQRHPRPSLGRARRSPRHCARASARRTCALRSWRQARHGGAPALGACHHGGRPARR